jgi:hypothetical protein
VVTGADRAELLLGLRALAAGEPTGNAVTGVAVDGKCAVLFPGRARSGWGWAASCTGPSRSSPRLSTP